MTIITTRTLQSVVPKQSAYFIRDAKVKGFGVRVNPSGSIRWIAEVRHQGRTVRKTIGDYPHLPIGEARKRALAFILQVCTGQSAEAKVDMSLEVLLKSYIQGDRLKPNTLKCYQEVVHFYLSNWLKKPLASITKKMVELREDIIKCSCWFALHRLTLKLTAQIPCGFTVSYTLNKPFEDDVRIFAGPSTQ
ncbi:Arm DNA-binding domain-containing protein [Desulforhopalus sp. 52FAK]